MRRQLLVVDDEANYRAVLGMMVAGLDVDVREACDGAAALEALATDTFDLVITDLSMPRMDGMALIDAMRMSGSRVPVVVITAHGSIDSAVDAMRRGAIDYLSKPFDEQRLEVTLHRAFELCDLIAENRRLRAAIEERFDFSNIIGESDAFVAALRTAGKVARSDATVLVRGESGTGKELVARAIHFNSRRARGPLVTVNCAALPETLLEAELFGAEAGAYTGANRRRKGRVELARGGTLFLDEIGDMPLSIQAKLLRLLQERTYTPLGSEVESTADVRFVFATNCDLHAMVESGEFRRDLFYRIAVVPVELPALRDRGDDVVRLAAFFVEKFANEMGCAPPLFAPSAIAAFRKHAFPGNVRELANVIERAVILSDSESIDAEDLGLDVDDTANTTPGTDGEGARTFVLPPTGVVLEDVERGLVRQALERTSGNKSRAARLLGLTRATLRYRIEKLGL